MPRYKLKDKCLFVDAKTLDESRKSHDIPFAHLMDHRATPVKVVKFNDTAGFIARFILFGVEIGLIPEIIHSEYGAQVKDPLGEVQAVLEMLRPYVEERKDGERKQHESPSHLGTDPHSGKYTLDFSVNWYGGSGVSKVPN